MSNKMLIDAIHPEETRVVVVRDKRVEDFDFEAASKKPLRGNIYLAKVTRVEPSLQAAFVEYGGNRHGFLAFSEIHPDYYQIPQADRAALMDDERADARQEDSDEAPARSSRRKRSSRSGRSGGERTTTATDEDPDDRDDRAMAQDAAEDAEATGQTDVAADGDAPEMVAPDGIDAPETEADAPGQDEDHARTDVTAADDDTQLADDDQTADTETADAASQDAPADLATQDGAVSSDDEPAGLSRAIEQVEANIAADVASAVDSPARDVEVSGEAESTREAPGTAAADESEAVIPSPAEDEARSEARGATVSNDTDAGPGEVKAKPARAPRKPRVSRAKKAVPSADAETKEAGAAEATPESPDAEADADAEAEAKPAPKRRRRTTTPRTKKSDDGLADPRVSDDDTMARTRHRETDDDGDGDGDSVMSMGNQDALEEIPERRQRQPRRQYKIQDVIRRRQILLVQVVKEERGTKGAALTTYLSLAGRYSVLMPNTDRGGGVSRKITDNVDRKRLKSLVAELDVPEGMGIILRTAGASRTKTEIKRDFEYLIRMWESVRELTLKSIAPELVYEEGNLVKRSIRDLYNKEIDEILVSGEGAYREAKDFMRMLMPTHAKNVVPYRESTPIFTGYGVEPQLDAMFSEQVTLPSKGYIVINPTEALVSIDVNSGRSTKENSIEDTALKTNLEAADEVARQLRLRDLAGLIVIDFIDMDEKRHNRSVEKRLKDALKLDRSRIQVGQISSFGLMEMSRQRIRQGMVETSMVACESCGGTGHVRSTQSVALHCLRTLEEHLLKHSDNHVTLKTSATVALYILNQKRSHLNDLEDRFGLEVGVDADEMMTGQHLQIISGAAVERDPDAPVPGLTPPAASVRQIDEEEAALDRAAQEAAQSDGEHPAGEVTADASDTGQDQGERSGSSRRRRRRRRRGSGGNSEDRREDQGSSEERDAAAADRTSDWQDDDSDDDGDSDVDGDADDSTNEDDGERNDRDEIAADAEGDDGDTDDRGSGRRRRGRRGGRRHRRDDETAFSGNEKDDEASIAQDAASVGEAALDAVETVVEAAEDVVDSAAEAAFGDDDDHRDGSRPHDESVVSDGRQPHDDEHTAPTVAAERNGGAPQGGAQDEPAADKPRRSGWWQRRSFF